MNPLYHVAELIAATPELKEVIKKAAIAGIKDFQAQRDLKQCDICDKELSREEINEITPNDFMVVCSNHRKYARYYQIDMVRAQLGMPLRGEGIIDQIKGL